MKHYMDIENLRDTEENIGGIVRPRNDGAFEVGDIIQITEKYDGANASIELIDGEFHCYSRKQELTIANNLNGFYQFVQTIDKERFAKAIGENRIVFGEWSGARNKIVYEKKKMFLVFDIFDKADGVYLPQLDSRDMARFVGFKIINELYYGPFISWDHCRTFLHCPAYGERQEGIVIKNQSKLSEAKDYFYLKIVNDDFKEKIKNKVKEVDLEKMAAQERASTLMETIVTRPRIEKMLFKLRDEGVLSDTLSNKDMATVAKNLPKRVWEDCLKEEKETVEAAGEFAGKACGTITMRIAKEIIVGK